MSVKRLLRGKPDSPLAGAIFQGDFEETINLVESGEPYTITPDLRTAYILASKYHYGLVPEEPEPEPIDFSEIDDAFDSLIDSLFDQLTGNQVMLDEKGALEVPIEKPSPEPPKPLFPEPERDEFGLCADDYYRMDMCCRLFLTFLLHDTFNEKSGPLPALPQLGLKENKALELGNPYLAKKIRHSRRNKK